MLGAEAFLAATVGAAVLGRFAVAQSILLVCGTLALFGTHLGIVRFIGMHVEDDDHEEAGRILVSGWIFSLSAGCVLGGALAAGAPWLAEHALKMPEVRTALLWVAAAVPLEALNQSTAAAFRGFRAGRDHVLVTDLFRNVLVFAAIVLSPFLRQDISALGALLFVGTLAGTVYGLYRAQSYVTGSSRRLKELRDTMRSLLVFSWPLSLWSILQIAAGRLQIIVVSLFLADTEVGVYSLLLRSLMALTFVQSVVNHTVPVEFAALYHRKDQPRLDALYRRTSLGILILALTIILPIVADSELVFGWLDPAFVDYHLLAVPLVIAQAVNVGTGPMGQLLIVANERSAMIAMSTLTAAVQLGGLLLLVPMVGLVGAVVADCSAILAGTAMRQWWGWRRTQVRFDGARTATAVFAAGLALLLGNLLRSGMMWGLGWEITAIPLVVAVWAAMLLASPTARKAARLAIFSYSRRPE